MGSTFRSEPLSLRSRPTSNAFDVEPTVMKWLRNESERVIPRDVILAKPTTLETRYLVPVPRLALGPPLKDKASRESVAAGLLNYPVLLAAGPKLLPGQLARV